MKMRLLTGTALAVIMAGSSAYAADVHLPSRTAVLPAPAPQFSWTGCYLGTNSGLGAGHTEWTDTQPNGNIDNGLLAPGARTAHTDMSGAVAGGQICCDVQFNNWVVGVGGSLNWSDITGTNMDQFNQTWTLRDKIDWYGTVTGRVGMAVNNLLLYGKGGLTFAHNQFEIENSGVTLGTPSSTRMGWTLGAGLEWAFAPNWSAFIEGSYFSFGAKTETFNQNLAFVNAPPTISVKPSFETFTLGINYRFGGLASRY